MSALAPDVLERVTFVTFFGLRLWDTATESVHSDGVDVRVYPYIAGRTGAPLQATSNRTGIFYVPRLPGLREYELSVSDADFWSAWPSPLPAIPFLVEVRDRRERFTPFVLQLTLPSTRRGPVVPPCIEQLVPIESPPQPAPAYVPLFSTAGRAVPAGLTAIRATLRDADTGGPAEYAVLEVSESGRLVARGIADARGEVAALMSYPEPKPPPASSPPSSPPGATAALSLSQQEWPLDIAVRYDAALSRYRPDPKRTPLADLCAVIEQPYAVLMSSPPAPLNNAVLRFGRELVLGAHAGASAELFIRPA